MRGWGESAYRSVTREIGDDEATDETFDALGQHMVVFVDYEEKKAREDENTWQAADLFEERKPQDDDADLQKLLDDVQSGTEGGSEELDKALSDALDESKQVKLTLADGKDGAVLTYDYLPDKPDENLKTVTLGDDLRLVPNPATGKKLKQGSLKVTYKVMENAEDDQKDGDKKENKEKEVTKTVVVNPDSKGRYVFKVPENLLVSGGIKVTAEFEDGEKNQDGDETQTQVTGTVAVTVANNDGQALIDTGAKITAGGDADAVSTLKTDVTTMADGTAVSKENASAPAEKKADDLAIQRPETEEYSGFVGDSVISVVVGETVNGKVTATKNEGYSYTFSPVGDTKEASEGSAALSFSAKKAVIVYTENGETKTAELKKKDAGSYQFALKKMTRANWKKMITAIM